MDRDTAPKNVTAIDAWCGACGFDLSQSTDSARCPECGRSIVETLTRRGAQAPPIHYRSRVKILGMHALAMSRGMEADNKPAHARGWIAIGPKATGVVAIGGRATGVVALGGMTMGIFAFGGMCIGLVTMGGLALGLLAAMGGLAGSLGIAFGGLAAGSVAIGGAAVGVYAMGGAVLGVHVLGPGGSSGPQIDELRRVLRTVVPTNANGSPRLLPLQVFMAAAFLGLSILLATPALCLLATNSGSEDDPHADDVADDTIST